MKLLIALLIVLPFSLNGQTQQETFVARVIYSEAGPSVSAFERYMVASVIKNRLNHRGFGKKATMFDIVNVKNAFECINHDANQNWRMSGEIKQHWDNVHVRKAWRQSAALAKGTFTPYKDIHFFLTKGTKVPKNFVATKYWKLTKLKSTKHFDFYNITEK